MAYTNNIPQAGDDPSQSQAEILANFQEIATLVAVNHVQFNDSDQGKHPFLQMPEQSSAPTTAANEGGLYTKAVSGSTELFYRKESNGDEEQLTGAFTAAANGELTLPGGLGLKWGSLSATTGGGFFTYASVGLTNFTSTTYNVQVTSGSSAVPFRVTALGSTGFNVLSSTSNTSAYWVAIGL